MLNTLLLILIFMFATLLLIARMMFTRLAVIHALTNSGMGSALTATAVALRSDARAKRELAKLVGGREQLAAADAADIALKQGEDLVLKHNRGQEKADKKKSFFK